MTFSPSANDRLWKDPEKDKDFPPFVRYILILLIIGGILLGGWYFFAPAHHNVNLSTLPLIQAGKTPYKIKAQDQGIPSIKHQDKLVYGRIRNDQNTPTVEHILPDPEPPLTQITEENSPVKMVDPYVPEDIELETSKTTPSKITSIDDLLEELPDEKPKEMEDLQEHVESDNKTTRKPILIQLGSLKNYDLAQAEWKRLSAKHKDLLGNLKPIIQKVDLGADKGIYYRLRVNQDSVEHAKKTSTKLQERKVECRVIL